MKQRLTKQYPNGNITLDASQLSVNQEILDLEIKCNDPFKAAVERLYEYEDRKLTPQEIKNLWIKVVDLELKLQGHDKDLLDMRENVIDEISELLQEYGFVEASMAIEEYRKL